MSYFLKVMTPILLATIQMFVLGTLSPLTAIVKADIRGKNISNILGVNAVKPAIELTGNANARISHLRYLSCNTTDKLRTHKN